jgi:hypothetical protein
MAEEVSKRKKKTRDEIVEVDLDGQAAYSINDAALYLHLSTAGLRKILEKHPEIPKYELGYGTEKFLLKKDLDELKRPRVSKD